MAVRWRTSAFTAVLAVATVASLTACGSSAPLPIFDGSQSSRDKLPADSLTDQFESEISTGSSRFLGTDSRGVDYYTVLTDDSGVQSICLVVVADASEHPMMGCGSLPLTVGVPQAGVTSATLNDFRDIEQPGEMVGKYVAVTGPDY